MTKKEGSKDNNMPEHISNAGEEQKQQQVTTATSVLQQRARFFFMTFCVLVTCYLSYQFIHVWFVAALYDRHAGGDTTLHHNSMLVGDCGGGSSSSSEL